MEKRFLDPTRGYAACGLPLACYFFWLFLVLSGISSNLDRHGYFFWWGDYLSIVEKHLRHDALALVLRSCCSREFSRPCPCPCPFSRRPSGSITLSLSIFSHGPGLSGLLCLCVCVYVCRRGRTGKTTRTVCVVFVVAADIVLYHITHHTIIATAVGVSAVDVAVSVLCRLGYDITGPFVKRPKTRIEQE
ncbi:hypothetical protein F4810DRAFT_680429 [Camillea tinctor]|nr:hypothetical protein F4810DRAFT_680429 [Camillea tinctor]